MVKTYKFVKPIHEKSDDRKQIEVNWSENVNRKEMFSIHDLIHQIKSINEQIANLKNEKVKIQTKVAEAKKALKIEGEEVR